jgi:hypothetical protein
MKIDNGTDPTDGDRSYEWCLEQSVKELVADEIAWHVAQIRADLAASGDAPDGSTKEDLAFGKGWRGAYKTIADDIEYRANQRAETDKEAKVDGRK